jgi:membrane protein
VFPALSMAFSLYGMLFDPVTVIPQLDGLREVVPPPVFALLSEAIHALVTRPMHMMGRGVVIGAVVTLWSSALGTKSLLSALNLAYEESERRGFFRFQAFSLLITLASILAAVLGLSLLVFLPAGLDFLGIAAHRRGLLSLGGILVLLAFVLLGLSVLYRFGPCRRAARWAWVAPGAVVATVIWLAASAVFSWYVSNIASYGMMYGPLGAVAGILVWFWVSAYAVLLGAELNSELELQTARDTTTGEERPAGTRGAFVADHVAHP